MTDLLDTSSTERLTRRRPDALRLARRVADADVANACYFRSGAEPGSRKALLQITERCNLRCAHCFVSATKRGDDMPVAAIADAIPRLVDARVTHVTITGGEPFVHPGVLEITTMLRRQALAVTICTNGVPVTDEHIRSLRDLGGVSVNVSLDGFAAESHGAFRGDRSSFDTTVENARRFGEAGLLKGILCTPNALAQLAEYDDLYSFAQVAGAEYVLMNPLSSFGRGIRTRRRLRADTRSMESIRTRVERASIAGHGPEPVFIRFPNEDKILSSCIAGEVVYVFVNGETAVCPYLVFAARNPGSQHRPEEFLIANLFDDDFASDLDAYDFHARYDVRANDTCGSCANADGCGGGCPAAVIASGGHIGDLDADVCPVA